MTSMHLKIYLLFVAFCILLTGCNASNQQNIIDNNNPQTTLASSVEFNDIKEGRHYRTEQYAADFKVFTVTTGYGVIHIEQDIFDTHVLQDAIRQIEKDLSVITEKIGTTLHPVQLYLVEKTIFGQPQNGAGHVYCTLQDISSGTYRRALVAELYGLPMLWQSVGLSRFIFEEPTDVSSLIKDYTKNKPLVLSLFPAYFMPEFCDTDTIQLTQKLSQSVTELFLQHNSLDEYIQLETADQAVQFWTSKYQLETPSFPEGHKEVSHLAVSHISAKTVTLCADRNMDRFRFELRPTDWIGTAEEYYLFLCHFYEGYEELLQRMQGLLPDAFEQVQNNANVTTKVRFISSTGQTKADFVSSEISIGEPGSLWHELCHILLPRGLALNGEDIWLSEGLANWFASELETKHGMPRRDSMFIYLTDPTVYQNVDPVTMEQQACIVTCYEQFTTLPTTSVDIDAGAFYRACGITTLLRRDLDNKNGLPINEYSVEGTKRTKYIGKSGNILTYPETMLAIDYLVEQYGIDMVVSGFLAQEQFDKWYGMTYTQFYKQFLGWVQSQYACFVFE